MITLNTRILTTEQPTRGSLAAVNIRKALKHHFPATKFSVSQSHSSISVKWQDLPLQKDVESLLAPFDICDNDSMTDYAGTKSTEFSKTYGGIHYLWIEQSLSPESESAIISNLAKYRPFFETNHSDQIAVNLENYKNGRLWYSGDFQDYFKEFERAFFENRTSSDESKDQVRSDKDSVKNLTAAEFENFKVSKTLSADQELYFNWLYLVAPLAYISNTDPIIKLALNLASDADKQALEYEIAEARKALNGEITDAEIEALDRYMAQELEKIKARDIVNIQPLSIDWNETSKALIFTNWNKFKDLEELDAHIAECQNTEEAKPRDYRILKTVVLLDDDFQLLSQNLLSDLGDLCKNQAGELIACDYYRTEQKNNPYYVDVSEVPKTALQSLHQPDLYVDYKAVLFCNQSGDSFAIDCGGYGYARNTARIDNSVKPTPITAAEVKKMAVDFINDLIIDEFHADFNSGNFSFNPDDAYDKASCKAFEKLKGKQSPAPEHLQEEINKIYKTIFKI